jgi:hypothetical protein
MAGYSGTPLAEKLGIKEGHSIALLDTPANFELTLGKLPPNVAIRSDLDEEDRFDVLVCFTDCLAALCDQFSRAKDRLKPAGGLWIAWPKKSSGIATDLTEDVVRGVGLEAGLVDNKVCAIDETWSGLRFVFRLKDRPAHARRRR